MTGFAVLLRKELLEGWRTMRLPIAIIVYVAFGVLSPATAKYLPQIIAGMASGISIELPTPSTADAITQFVKNVGGTLTVAAILLAMGMIAAEMERGTAAFILSKPVSRGAFVAAKLAALALTLALALAASGAAAYVYTAVLFEPPPAAAFAAMVLLLWLAQLAIAALTLLASAAVRSVVAAGAIGFAAYVALAIVSMLPVLGPLTPAGLQNAASEIALGGAPAQVPGAIAVNIGLVAASGLLACLALRRKEV